VNIGIFQVVYLIGFVVGSVVRAWYSRKYRQDKLKIFRQEGMAVGVLASLWGIAILVPFIFMFTNWLNFSDYDRPNWAGWAGVATFIGALWLLWRSHVDLGRNWSVTTEIKEKHTLVTDGIFRYVRRPMYAAHGLWGIAQALLIPNWIAGPASLAVFLPLYLMRVPREERTMLEQFGEQYLRYQKRTGRLIPRLSQLFRVQT